MSPASTALGYESRTLTCSGAYVPDSSTDNAFAHLASLEERHIHGIDNDLRELSETQVGGPKIPSFTGSTVPVMSEGKSSDTILSCFTNGILVVWGNGC